MLLGHMGQDCGDIQKEIPIERVTEGQQVGRQNRGDDGCQQLSLHLDPCHVLGKVSGVGFACDDSIAGFGEGGGGQNRCRDKVSRGVGMEGEGVILGLGLDKEEATRRELGAELGGSDLKDRCFPGGVADTGVTQKIRDDHEGGRDVFGERHFGGATRRGCVGKG
jgi:hypothetical protein